MIEKFMILIIQELGPTGLLICELYLILNRHLKKMADHIGTINGEVGEIGLNLKELNKPLKEKKGE